MSVSVSVNPEIDLFVATAPLGSPDPIGKWRGAALVAGDGTGGTTTIDITSPTPLEAGRFMWSLEDWQFTDSPGPGAGTVGIFQWETGDPVIIAGASVVFILATGFFVQPPIVATLNGSTYAELKRWRYVARPRNFNIRWRTQYSNTNLHTYQFEAWGFLWNQEYAKAGAVRRPQD